MENFEKELIKYGEDTRLKIGAEDGHCFFYCGTVGDFLWNMSDYSYKMRCYAIRKQKKARKRLDAKMAAEPTLERWARNEARKEDPVFSIDSYQREIRTWMKAVEKAYETWASENAKAEAFKDIWERKISYIKDADPVVEEYGGIVCVVEGAQGSVPCREL